MTTHSVVRAYRFALKRGFAKCGICNRTLTAQDDIHFIDKMVAHKNCAAPKK
jgi:hypothetical protein